MHRCRLAERHHRGSRTRWKPEENRQHTFTLVAPLTDFSNELAMATDLTAGRNGGI